MRGGDWLCGRAAALTVVLVFCLWAGGCSKEKSGETPLVQVGDSVITRELVDYTFLSLPTEEQVKYLDRAGRRQLVDNLVTVELLYQEARRQKLDQDPQVQMKLDRARHEVLVDELINRGIMPADLYRMFQERFIKARAMVIELPENPSEAVQAQAQAAAEKLYAELNQGSEWEAVARRKLAAPLLLHEQDFGYVSREWLQDEVGFEVEEALFSLTKPGEISRPVRFAHGYLIGQVLETSGRLNPEGYTSELADYLLNEKKEEVYRGYVTDLRTRRQKEIRVNLNNMEAFLSLGDRRSGQMAPETESGASVESGESSAPSGE